MGAVIALHVINVERVSIVDEEPVSMDGKQVSPASAWSATGTVEQPVSPSVASGSRGESARSLIWEIVQTVLLTIAIFLAVRSVVQNFRVEGASMDPTLHSGQYLLINKVLYARTDGTLLDRFFVDSTPADEVNFVFSGPQRGDIIVFRSPGQADKDFIKRVIGLPGETLYADERGRVWAKPPGEPAIRLEEPYLDGETTSMERVQVPDGYYFMMGDNRENSADSRTWGPEPEDQILGVARARYWPLDRLGVF
jgi:signal peptidase I